MRHVDQHGQHADAHRAARVLARVVAGRQHLDGHEGQQAGREGPQRLTGHVHRVRVEGAVTEQRAQQRTGQHEQRRRRRRADQQHPAQAPVERAREGLAVAAGVLARQARQDHGGEGDRQHAERELHQPVRVIQPGHAAGDQERRHHGVEHQVDLRHRRAEHARPHEPEDASHAGVGKAHPGPRQIAERGQGRQLPQQLQQAADDHADGQRQHRHVQARRQPDRGADHRQVQEQRRQRRREVAPEGVEHAADRRRQRHQRQVPEGDPQQRGRSARRAADRRRSPAPAATPAAARPAPPAASRPAAPDPSVPRVWATRSRTSAGSRVVRYSDSTGTKACEKAPSANSRRRKFGMRKATKNASAAGPAPKVVAMTVSRT